MSGSLDPAVFNDVLYFVLVSPPPGGPEEGPGCHCLEDIGFLGRFRPESGGTPIYYHLGPKRSWEVSLAHLKVERQSHKAGVWEGAAAPGSKMSLS